MSPKRRFGPADAGARKALRRVDAGLLKVREELKVASDPTANSLLRAQLPVEERRVIDPPLDIKACDRAMGNGHFLVGAVDHLTDQIVHILGDFPERSPVIQMIEQVRQGILKSLAERELTPDVERLTDTNLLRRPVMKCCIHGADLNATAVELAKLALSGPSTSCQ